MCCDCVHSPQSLTSVSSWGFTHLSPSCKLNYLEYIRTYLFFARSKEATISALAASAFSQPSTFTHLPFSRSL
ncbi:hypothetical protein D6R51_22745 [Escherichia coli]|nr:hypothetical protein [Escherichia coli]KAA2188119.1 hypothetical protein EA252_04070 [Escherichia coli]MBW3728900.1 hypothetical protein [Escherichia coli]